MKRLSERDLEKLIGELPEGQSLEPPPDLAFRIKAEIPDDLELPITIPTRVDDRSLPSNLVPRPWLHRHRWLMAASIATMIGGSFLTYRLYWPMGSPDHAPRGEMATTRPTTPAGQASPDRTVEVSRGPADDGLRGKTEPLAKEAAPAPLVTPAPATTAAAPREHTEPSSRARITTTEPRPQELKAIEGQLGTLGNGNRAVTSSGGGDGTARHSEEATGEVAHPTPLPETFEGLVADQVFELAEPPAAPPAPPPAPKMPSPGPTSQGLASEALRRARPAEIRDEARRLQEVPSTGGTVEPNGAPYGDVFFQGYGTNPFITTEDDRLSTFGLDVDTASYAITRRYLHEGHLPPPEAVRLEEMVNNFDYGDPPPTEGDFALRAEGAPSLYGENDRTYLLRFNLRGRELDAADRASAQLVFVVDVSGSMAQENRLGLVRNALALLLDQLRPDDRLALVVYGTRGRVLLEPTADHDAIRRAIAGLQPEGSTNAEEGLRLAYELAAHHRRPGTINRVILCSDGVANVGLTSASALLAQIRQHAEQGIELTTLGFGMGNYNDTLMEQLADRGNGHYAYIDTLDEAHRVLVENLTGNLQTLAAEARAQVDFEPALVDRYRLLGYENRDIADQRFRDDTVDAGEIGMGHNVTVLYEVVLKRRPKRHDHLATLRLRYASIAAHQMVELERRVSGADFASSWQEATPALRLTSLVAELAEALRGSYWARDADLDDVFRRAQRLTPAFEGDRDIAELVALIGQAAELRRRAR